jgi:hypothetical protein
MRFARLLHGQDALCVAAADDHRDAALQQNHRLVSGVALAEQDVARLDAPNPPWRASNCIC